jgi:hypothetical protein
VLSSSYHPYKTPRSKAKPLRPHSRNQSHTPAKGGPSKRFDVHGPHLEVGVNATAKTPSCCQSAPLDPLAPHLVHRLSSISSSRPSPQFRASQRSDVLRSIRTHTGTRATICASSRTRPRSLLRMRECACMCSHKCTWPSMHLRTAERSGESEPICHRPAHEHKDAETKHAAAEVPRNASTVVDTQTYSPVDSHTHTQRSRGK